jgi:hypothetical protein
MVLQLRVKSCSVKATVAASAASKRLADCRGSAPRSKSLQRIEAPAPVGGDSQTEKRACFTATGFTFKAPFLDQFNILGARSALELVNDRRQGFCRRAFQNLVFEIDFLLLSWVGGVHFKMFVLAPKRGKLFGDLE